MATPIVMQGVSKRFGKTQAVDNVSLRIEPGELFFLLGPSGCGKTTLLRSIAGFCDIDEGRIVLGDDDVTRKPAHKRDTGMVFQSYALWPHLTLRENVAFGLRMRRVGHEERSERVERALKLVKMEDRADSRPNELSGGQQQRIALARALVVEPRCLLLDEPLSNLDAKLRIEMRGEIRRICKDAGLTAVYVTHDQKEALSIADRIAVMRDGCVLQMGTPLDIYRNPHSAFIAGFIGETNSIPGKFVEASGKGVTVDCALGRLLGRSGGEFHAKGDVEVVIRPEALLLDVSPRMENCFLFSGRVVSSVYLGEVAQHCIELPGKGAAVCMRASELNPRRDLSGGNVEITVGVRSEDVLVFNRTEAR